HVPDPLLLLRSYVSDPVAELRTRAPLPPSQQRSETIPVDLVHEGETEGGAEREGRRTRHVLNDVPRTFDAHRRSYATRAVTVLPQELPGAPARWPNHAHCLDEVYQYAAEET